MEAGANMGTVLGVAGFIISTLLGLVLALVSYINREQRRELENDIRDLKTKNDEQEKRLQKEELATARLDGEMKLAASEQRGLESDMHEIKKQMVTKVEFETRMNNQDKLLGMVLMKLDGTKYPSQQVPRPTPSESYPPRRGG